MPPNSPEPGPLEKLDYARPEPATNESQSRMRWRLLAGFLLGVAVLGMAWGVALSGRGDLGTVVFAGLVVPAIVFVAGVTVLCFRHTRTLGGGLLLALAMGSLVLFVTCGSRIH